MAAEIVRNLTTLPSASSSPPELKSGKVALFRDTNWSGNPFVIDIGDYASGKRHMTPNSINDSATWLSFNLPLGIVMTLTRDVPSDSSRPVADLNDCGSAVDLVGDGTTIGVDLGRFDMNDQLTMFFWREVDLVQGAVELFRKKNFESSRSTLFLSEWPRGTIISIKGWDLDEAISSARWRSLADRQEVEMYQHEDGSGTRYENIKGWGSFREIPDFEDVGFNDSMTSWLWMSIAPKKEEIEPIKVTSSSTSGVTPIVAHDTETNDTSVEQNATIGIKQETGQTITVSTTDTYASGVNISQTTTSSIGGELIAKVEVSIGVDLSYDYSHETSDSRTTTKTAGIDVSHSYTIPPHSKCVADLTVTTGTMPATEYKTKATRWYDIPVANGQRDPANSNWYKRVEDATFWVNGVLATEASSKITAYPL